MELTYTFPLFVVAWFVQMGLHEVDTLTRRITWAMTLLDGQTSIHPFSRRVGQHGFHLYVCFVTCFTAAWIFHGDGIGAREPNAAKSESRHGIALLDDWEHGGDARCWQFIKRRPLALYQHGTRYGETWCGCGMAIG